MGNSHTTFNSLHKVVATDYQLVGKNTSIRWGELFEMKNTKTGQMVFMQEKHAVDLETHQKTVEECTYHISLTHKNLSTIYGFAGGESLDAFTNTYKVCVFFEHVINSLNGVIRARRVPLPSQNKNQQRYTQAFQYFDESELLRFMNQLVEVFGFLQRNGINQGDVTPDVCFFSREGALKVLDRKLIYNDVSSFEQAEQGNTNIFLTPTELGALANDKAKPSENRYKADVFRLGMTLLECATLQKSSEIYDWNSYIINLDILSSRLIEVKERYSSSFYDPLREMLRFEEDKRPDFIVLCRHLEEEAAKNLAANMAQQYGEDDIEGRKSIFGMGPKLITNFPVKLGVSPSTKGQNMMSYDPSPAKRGSVKVQQVGRESRETFEKRAQRNSAMVVNKKEEDLDDTTEFESDMKVNKVPFTETRLSVERIKVNDSPARRLQKRISENNSVEKKNTSPDVSLHQSPSNTPRQRFSLTLKDFFRRDSPNRTSALQENPSAKKDKEEAPKVPHNSSPKMTFGDLSSTNRHRRVMSGAPNFSYQSPIHNTNGINPPKSRKQPDAAGDSPSHSFDLRSKPPYGNGTIRHTRTPTLPLPAKEYLNSTVSGYRNANDNSISQNDGISPSEYYTASSNPATQRVSGQRLSYKGNGVSESILAGDNGDVSISIDPSEALGVSIDEQRRQTATNRTRPSHIPEESQASRVASMVPQAQGQNGAEGEKGNEQDLIETILRRVLNSAGISPKKQNNIVLVDNRVELGYAKPQSLIRPLQIEMNENIERVEERPSVQKYNVENARASYNSSGSTYNKLGLQGVRDERRVSARPLEDQYNQSMDPRAVVSPKFGFRGISVERKSVIDEIRGSIAMEKNRPYGENGGNNWEPSSAGMKSSMAPKSYLDTPMGMNVEDRFEQAMERSRRSKGFMRDLAGKINRSSSRTTSAEPSMRGSHVAGGLMFGNGYFSNNNHEIGLNQ